MKSYYNLPNIFWPVWFSEILYFTFLSQLRFQQRDDLKMDIKELKKNLMSSLSMVNTSAGTSQNINNNGDGINAIFEEYANKLLEYENITEEVEWNELTASEFVTSIQTTIGNIIFIPKYMKTYHCKIYINVYYSIILIIYLFIFISQDMETLYQLHLKED